MAKRQEGERSACGRLRKKGSVAAQEEYERVSASTEWKPIPWCNGRYSVSKCGLVRSELKVTMRSNGRPITNYPRILKQNPDSKGYLQVSVYPTGVGRKGHPKLVHRLVYETWVRPIEPEEDIDHKDNNQLNNRVENLQALVRDDHAKLTIGRIKEKEYQRGLRDGWASCVEYLKRL